MKIIEALGLSLLGMVIVFIVLIILMGFIKIMSFVFQATHKPTTVDKNEKSTVLEQISDKTPARGSCGELNLFDVPDRTAAMIMAIVADALQAPLNELRFISIKEIKE